MTKPAVVIVVTLNGTSGSAGYGGQAAAPVFRDVATAALRFLDVPKDLPEVEVAEKRESKTDTNDLAITALDPDAEAELAAADPDDVVVGPEQKMMNVARKVTGPKVPNFQGKTMREVEEEAASRGLPIEVMGTGIARLQMPPPGAMLPPRREGGGVQFVR